MSGFVTNREGHLSKVIADNRCSNTNHPVRAKLLLRTEYTRTLYLVESLVTQLRKRPSTISH